MKGLTFKQQRICDLITQGLSSKEIARKIGIGHRTVESHRYDIYKKMGVKNALQLVRKVLAPAQ